MALSKMSRMIDGTRFNEHTECSICLGDFQVDDIVTPLPCDHRHYFHTKCIKDWSKQKLQCPLCNKPFTAQQLDEYHQRFSIVSPRVNASYDPKDANDAFRNFPQLGANAPEDNQLLLDDQEDPLILRAVQGRESVPIVMDPDHIQSQRNGEDDDSVRVDQPDANQNIDSYQF